MKIDVRDVNHKIIESTETEVLSKTKMKPFTKREILEVDLENYREIVEVAKNEFKLLQRLDFTAGLIKNENPIKTLNVKRANRDRDQNGVESTIRKSPWGNLLSKYSFFSKQNLNCLEISSIRSNVLHVSYIAEFQFES